MMFSRDFVSQRPSYSHPLWSELPKIVLTVDQAKELVNKKDWEQLILSHGRLALLIAGYYIARGADVNETVSAAMLGLCRVVDKMKHDFENINPRGFIVSAIHSVCYDSAVNDRNIPSGRNEPMHTCLLLDHDSKDNEFDIVEFDEIMELIVKSDLERKVMNLRRRSFEDNEIAEILGISRSSVSRLRKTLHERFVSYVK